MQTCRDWLNRCHDYLEDELVQPDRAEFEHHMVLCPPCGSFLITYRKTVSLTQRLRCDEIPDEIRQRFREYLRERVAES